MQNRLMVCLMALALGTVAFAREKPAQEKPAQAADAYVGTWAGTWTSEDGGSGTVELTLEKGADGKPSGSIKSSGGDADHAAPFKSLSIDDNKVTGKWEYPAEGGGEVTMDGTLDGATAKGTWVLRQGQATAAVAQGTWTTTKK